MRETPHPSGKEKGLRRKLMGYFVVFLVVVLFVVWFFQVFLLKFLYRQIKYREVRSVTAELALVAGTNQLQATSYQLATDYSTCVLVYRVDGGGAFTQVVSVEVLNRCSVHMLTAKGVLSLYENACNHAGEYLAELTFGGVESDISGAKGQNNSAVAVSVTRGADGEEYLILADTELFPLNATVRTLQFQFLWITMILVIVAAVFAWLFSRRISRPLANMSEAALRLAQGDYQAEFSGEGSLETERLAEALNYAASELSKNDALQKELIANISHDLRTPLTMIEGYGEVMRDIPGENTPENVQVIIDEAQHLSTLVTDLLDLSKIRSGTQQPVPEPVALTELIRETLTRYEKLRMAEYHVIFESREEVSVFADRTMLLQVIYNLINNAIHYTGEDKTVYVIQSVDGDVVRVSVRDTGAGIDPEEIPVIWDRYYKVDRVHRRSRIGSGIGLSIVKGILQLHGARYGVESKKGDGSVFWFELPVWKNGQEGENTDHESDHS